MKKRTPRVKAKMGEILYSAILCLEDPRLPKILERSDQHDPSDIALFLRTDDDLIAAPGRLQEKKYVLDDLQIAADYLSHPSLSSLQRELNSYNIANALRQMIRDLK
jgi:hypothetical protein